MPVVDIETRDLDPAMVVSPMGDVGGVSVKVDMSVLSKAFSSSFMGVKSKANKIMFIIDYSASMKGRDKVMRYELAKPSTSFPPSDPSRSSSSPALLGWRGGRQSSP